MRTQRSDVEERLTALLRAQAESVPVGRRSWLPPASPVEGSKSPRRTVLALGVAAALLGVVAVVVGGRGQGSGQLRTGPPASHGPASTPTSAVTSGRLHAETRQVSLTADGLVIDAGGERFVAPGPVEVAGDPGSPNQYTTLELTWYEHGVEMRLFVYFTSDGREWWSNEIRTYDGRRDGDWLVYRGDFFRRPLGAAFVGDFAVTTGEPEEGRLEIAGMHLEAFRRPPACHAATGPLVLEPGVSPVKIRAGASGYGATVRLLASESCLPVPDEDRYAYEWRSADPAVVTVSASLAPTGGHGRHRDLRPVGRGRTTVHVTARDPGTGTVVAETGVEVVVE